MQSCNIAAQVVETGAAGSSCAVQVDAVQALHNVHMVRNLKRRNDRLAKALHFHVFAVVLANRNRLVDDVWNDHHSLFDFLGQLLLFDLQVSQLLCHSGHLCFDLFCLLLLTFCHQSADLFGEGVALRTQVVAAGFGIAELFVQLQHLVHQDQLFVLEFFLDVFFDKLRVCPDQFDVQHSLHPPCYFKTAAEGRRI